MNQKFVMFALLILVAMSVGGFAYAQWYDVIMVSSAMQFGTRNMGFVEPLTCTDDETTQDVGEFDCYFTDPKTDSVTGMQGYNTAVITINNGYPGYEVHCNFTLQNIGTLPLHINGTIISDPDGVLKWSSTLSALVDDDGKPVLNIVTTPNLVRNEKLFSGEKLEAQIAVHITQNAQEYTTYTFEVKITYKVV